MQDLIKLSQNLMKNQHFNSLAVGVLDFNKKSFSSFELIDGQENLAKDSFFDLASLTKPLTLSLSYFLRPNLFTKEMHLLLNHRASLPAVRRLSRGSYLEDLLSYKIKESITEYSDLSALRLMIEIEKKLDGKLYDLVEKIYDIETMNWLKLSSRFSSPATGFRNKKIISGSVHDDNAFNIVQPLSHAGLFSTIDGILKTLLNFEEKTSFIFKMKEALTDNKQSLRFINGWDTISDTSNTMAGRGCSNLTFGHLGFTGTSIWIDPISNLAHVILTNATKNYWYDRHGLTNLRKSLGSHIWENFVC